MADHARLLVWQKAHRVALESNRIAIKIRSAAYGSLKAQIIRAAISIPANIVEGRAQKGDREFSRFLRYSAASAAELEYHLQVGQECGVINPKEANLLRDDVSEVRRMLAALIQRLENTKPANKAKS